MSGIRSSRQTAPDRRPVKPKWAWTTSGRRRRSVRHNARLRWTTRAGAVRMRTTSDVPTESCHDASCTRGTRSGGLSSGSVHPAAATVSYRPLSSRSCTNVIVGCRSGSQMCSTRGTGRTFPTRCSLNHRGSSRHAAALRQRAVVRSPSSEHVRERPRGSYRCHGVALARSAEHQIVGHKVLVTRRRMRRRVPRGNPDLRRPGLLAGVMVAHHCRPHLCRLDHRVRSVGDGTTLGPAAGLLWRGAASHGEQHVERRFRSEVVVEQAEVVLAVVERYRGRATSRSSAGRAHSQGPTARSPRRGTSACSSSLTA